VLKAMGTGIHRMRLIHLLASGFAVLLLLTTVTLGVARGVSDAPPAPRQKTTKQKKSSKPPAKDLPMPFHVGETLNYRVSWSVFTNAANVQLNILERRGLFDWPTWHFRASAHTLSPARSLATIDDQFDSYTDSVTLESRQFELHLDELGRKKEQTLYLIAQGQTPRPGVPATLVLADTRDPLGALYALRSVDWQKTPEYRAPVYDGRNLFDMRARLEALSENVAVAAGSYSASRISIHIYQSGNEVTGSNFLVWLAHDTAHTPVQMQAELPFGSLRVELTSASQ
jgi:hypothetical protein